MKRKGFTLIELLIVIAIIGIVAAIAIPNLLTALQKGKQKSTMGDMKTIGNAIESYLTDWYMAPGAGNETDTAGLENYLEPFYIKVLPPQDGWGTPFGYISNAAADEDRDEYSIFSYGRDAAATAFSIDDNGYVVTTMPGFNADMCFSNGIFTYAPKVK